MAHEQTAHNPWWETYARETFFDELEKAIFGGLVKKALKPTWSKSKSQCPCLIGMPIALIGASAAKVRSIRFAVLHNALHFAPAANVRNDWPHRRVGCDGPRSAMGRKCKLAVLATLHCSEWCFEPASDIRYDVARVRLGGSLL